MLASILCRYAYKDRIWSLLKGALAEWTLPEETKDETEGQDPDKAQVSALYAMLYLEFHETCLSGTFHFMKKDSK